MCAADRHVDICPTHTDSSVCCGPAEGEEGGSTICANLTEGGQLRDTVSERDKLEEITEWLPVAITVKAGDNNMFLVYLNCAGHELHKV
jgi:hypothetical protein